ncbi:hypothetical protein GJ689_23915 [Rhodoplanes serenus]|uniref:DUF6671 domain-containing protein n=2 Tax=Rhodoplanes serenus TaxID=200615 RepID=A0A9X5AU33_9BRAD|nr:DUF6671 family protein [Rhodoplanes serenus]MTW19247.1 hypothetical protein [Rhodoplanes serenus]
MHGKERVIAPLLRRFLGLRVETVHGLDTDRFGTFTREVPRPGSQRDAARAKIAAAFAGNPGVRVAVASEGRFGPHPIVPFAPLGVEIVLLADRDTGIEILGQFVDLDAMWTHAIVTDIAAARIFAESIGFPVQGIIVSGCKDEGPCPESGLFKDVQDHADLERAVDNVIARCGAAVVETDMRAHCNPRRMKAIKRATVNLIREFGTRCPNCDRPGFVITERIPGAPCALCGTPTRLIRAEASACAGCGHRAKNSVGPPAADPSLCDACNP